VISASTNVHTNDTCGAALAAAGSANVDESADGGYRCMDFDGGNDIFKSDGEEGGHSDSSSDREGEFGLSLIDDLDWTESEDEEEFGPVDWDT
jgi:hypothetical protein